jgi:hypothetical protein
MYILSPTRASDLLKDDTNCQTSSICTFFRLQEPLIFWRMTLIARLHRYVHTFAYKKLYMRAGVNSKTASASTQTVMVRPTSQQKAGTALKLKFDNIQWHKHGHCSPHEILFRDQIIENNRGVVCGICERKRNAYVILVANLKGRDRLEELGLGGNLKSR